MPTTVTKKNRTTPDLSLSVQFATDADGLPTRSQVRKWVKAALRQAAEVTVRFVGREEGQGLNRDYRGKDYATNVLSFIYESQPLMGDVVICAPVVAHEAREQGKSLEAHYAHLLVHGTLHLQGFDHETEPDAQVMEAHESEIVKQLGYADPYAGEA